MLILYYWWPNIDLFKFFSLTFFIFFSVIIQNSAKIFIIYINDILWMNENTRNLKNNKHIFSLYTYEWKTWKVSKWIYEVFYYKTKIFIGDMLKIQGQMLEWIVCQTSKLVWHNFWFFIFVFFRRERMSLENYGR